MNNPDPQRSYMNVRLMTFEQLFDKAPEIKQKLDDQAMNQRKYEDAYQRLLLAQTPEDEQVAMRDIVHFRALLAAKNIFNGK